MEVATIVIYVLSQIWKSGARIERQSDDSLKLINHQNVPTEVLKAAEPIFNEIDAYLKSVEGMNACDLTNWKIIMHMCGWLISEPINNFLNNDEHAAPLAYDVQAKLAVNGWKDIYEDYRQYESAESIILKNELYERAVAYANEKKGA